MTRHSVQPGDRIFVKDNGFLSFAKNMGKNISKNISKNLSGKYGQKLLDHAKQSATDSILYQKERFKIRSRTKAEATGDLIGNKIADKITRVSKTSPKK